jgi:hypothetical protein
MKKFITVTAAVLLLLFSCNDPCRRVNCGNKGACNQGACICNAGYEGRECEKEIRAKFLGTSEVAEECRMGTSAPREAIYQINIVADTDNADRVNITGIYRKSRSVYAIVSGDRFTIPLQSFGSDGDIEGEAKKTADRISLSYSVISGAQKDECTVNGRLVP